MITTFVGGPKDGEVTNVETPAPSTIMVHSATEFGVAMRDEPMPPTSPARERPTRYHLYRLHRSNGSRFEAYVHDSMMPLDSLPETYSREGIAEAAYQRIFNRAMGRTRDAFSSVRDGMGRMGQASVDLSVQLNGMANALNEVRAEAAARRARRARIDSPGLPVMSYWRFLDDEEMIRPNDVPDPFADDDPF